jgi:signal transduction histidine kinase
MIPLLEKMFPSLAKKVALAVVGVILLFGGTFLFFAHRTGYSILEGQAQLKAQGIAGLVREFLLHANGPGRDARIENILSIAAAGSDVVDAFVLKEDGTLLWNAKPGNLPGRLPLDQFHEIPGKTGEKILSVEERDTSYEYIVLPLFPSESRLDTAAVPSVLRGYFGMKVAMDDLRAFALRHRTTNILMTVMTFLGLGIIFFVALSVLVIKPIGALHAHIRKVGDDIREIGQETRKVFPLLPEPRTHDEIADLWGEFNHLLTRLNEANGRLFDLHQSQLEQADRLATTGEMAASMAHEIKNPISGVLAAVQVFDSETGTDDPRKEILAEMMVQLGRVNHAVNDLLSYARPSPPALEEFSLNELIQKTIGLFSQQTKGQEISISSDLTGAQLLISADRKQLQQVLWNILLNAVQALDGAGSVSVRSMKDNSSAVIQVSDTGKGMSADQINRVFQPFFTTKHKGTGLGMTISKRIVEQHHGTISIASEPKRGTTVTILLPQGRK